MLLVLISINNVLLNDLSLKEIMMLTKLWLVAHHWLIHFLFSHIVKFIKLLFNLFFLLNILLFLLNILLFLFILFFFLIKMMLYFLFRWWLLFSNLSRHYLIWFNIKLFWFIPYLVLINLWSLWMLLLLMGLDDVMMLLYLILFLKLLILATLWLVAHHWFIHLLWFHLVELVKLLLFFLYLCLDFNLFLFFFNLFFCLMFLLLLLFLLTLFR